MPLQVKEETRHLHATRKLLKLQRASGFSLQELNMVAKLCGEYTSDVNEPAGSLLSITLDFAAYLRVLRGLVRALSHSNVSQIGRAHV